MSPTYHQNETPLDIRPPIRKLKADPCDPVEVRTDFSEFINPDADTFIGYKKEEEDTSQKRWTDYCAKGDFTQIEPEMLAEFVKSGYMPYNVRAALEEKTITLDELNDKVIDRFVQTGWNMIRDVNKTDNELVVDLACATNGYKKYIPNLCAIDIEPYPGVDIKTSFCETTLKSNSADVVLCMGGQTFRKRFKKQIFGEIFRILKPGGRVYFRSSLRRLQQFAVRGPRTPEGKINPIFKTFTPEECRTELEVQRAAYGFKPKWYHDFQYCEHQGDPEMSVMSPILMSLSKEFSDANNAKNASWMTKGGHHYFFAWQKKESTDPIEVIEGGDFKIKEDGTYGLVGSYDAREAYYNKQCVGNMDYTKKDT